MPTRNITLLVRAVGARAAARDMNLVTRATGGLHGASKRANKEMGLLASTMALSKQAAKTGALGLGLAGAAAAKTGIQYNAMMQSQKIAFESFLGSAKEADSYLRRLYKLAAVTPFEFPDLVKGTRTMLAYGMASENAMKTMTLLGDAIASAPTEDTANQIARTTRALGQVQAAGILHAQDLNQLVDAGVTSVPKLAKSMGMSTKQFRKQMMLGKIDAEKFFTAQRALWENDPIYSGMAEKQAKTFYGRLATLHDYTVQTLGIITEDAFKSLTNKGLPAAIAFTQKANKIWQNQKLPFEEKVSRTKDLADKIFRPLLRDFSAWWKREEVTHTLQDAFAWTLGQAMKGAWMGVKATFKGLVQTLWTGNWTAKIGAAYLLYKLGMKSKILKAAGKLAWTRMFGKKGKGILGKTEMAGVVNIEAGVVNVNGVGGAGKKPGFGRRVGRAARTAAGAAAATTAGEAAILGAATLGPIAGLFGAAALERKIRGPQHAPANRATRHTYLDARGFPTDKKHAVSDIRPGEIASGPQAGWTAGRMNEVMGHMASGGYAGRSGYYEVGEHGRERVFLPQGANVKPDGGGQLHATMNLVVDGKVLATAVHRQAVKSASTR